MYSYYEEKKFARIEKEEGTFFMFFTSGLLYWVLKSLSLLKNTSRIFLIAAGLDENEKKVLNKHTEIQIFYIKNHCTDKHGDQSSPSSNSPIFLNLLYRLSSRIATSFCIILCKAPKR